MDSKDFVTYETAKRLKECGFNEPCNYGYCRKWYLDLNKATSEPKVVHSNAAKNFNDNRKGASEGRDYCSAPTLWQAQKWLREKHNIHVQIEAVMQQQWTYMLVDLAPWSDMDGEWHDRIPDRDGYPQIATYEQALQEGIKAALELIKPENE